jgi:hypothetical protein
MEAKDTLWHINWGDGDDFYVIAPTKKIAIDRMPEGKGMVNYVVKLDHLYKLIFKAGIKYAWDILSPHLPLNVKGECFYCGVGSTPDEKGYHHDKDNCWGGDQLCWNNEYYDDARELQSKLKEWGLDA